MKLVFVFLLLVSLNTHARSGNGNEVGNGGDGILCKDKPLQLFDYYEQNKVGLWRIESPQNWKEIAKIILTKFEKVDKSLATQYLKVFSKIESRMDFTNEELKDVLDSKEVSLPKDCRLIQLAVQRDNNKGERRITISKNHWEKLDHFNRAGLILHEIIYEHFAFIGETNSLKVREFNGFLVSGKIRKMDQKDYQNYKRSFKLPLY